MHHNETCKMNAKQCAAAEAVKHICDGMTVGLGTGSTAAYAIRLLGQRIHQGLSVQAVASSLRSEYLAREAGIPIIPFSEVKCIDVYDDGADEVDRNLNLLKGGGGALLREKILAFHAKEFIVIADSSKMVESLGKFSLPVEIIPFACELTVKQLRGVGSSTSLRMQNSKPYITDNGNFIIDCDFIRIEDVAQLHDAINDIPGVVENGLFLSDMVAKVLFGHNNGEVETKLSPKLQHQSEIEHNHLLISGRGF